MLGLAKADRQFERDVKSRVALIRALPSDAHVLVADQEELYWLIGAAPDLADRCWLADFSLDPSKPLDRRAIYTLDLSRNFERHFRRPPHRHPPAGSGHAAYVSAGAGKQRREAYSIEILHPSHSSSNSNELFAITIGRF
jgi:hypothetical protein